MDLIKISDLTTKLGISSRSLRYYEQVGLIRSHRSEHEKYRFFDNENVERLKLIMILRKTQIPIKDILRIYESEDMNVVVETLPENLPAFMDAPCPWRTRRGKRCGFSIRSQSKFTLREDLTCQNNCWMYAGSALAKT